MARQLPHPVCTNHRITAHIYGNEHRHLQSHFHVVNGDIWDSSIDLETGEIIEGEDNLTPAEKKEVEAYRQQNLELLRRIWRAKNVSED